MIYKIVFNELKLVVELLKMGGVKVSDSMNLGMNKTILLLTAQQNFPSSCVEIYQKPRLQRM